MLDFIKKALILCWLLSLDMLSHLPVQTVFYAEYPLFRDEGEVVAEGDDLGVCQQPLPHVLGAVEVDVVPASNELLVGPPGPGPGGRALEVGVVVAVGPDQEFAVAGKEILKGPDGLCL